MSELQKTILKGYVVVSLIFSCVLVPVIHFLDILYYFSGLTSALFFNVIVNVNILVDFCLFLVVCLIVIDVVIITVSFPFILLVSNEKKREKIKI